ncbi:MAG: TrmH family RNA methyltransferase [Candidatus Dojkabacteria bacterium]
MKYNSLDDISITDSLRIAVVDRPQYPGNLGTIIRSADAFGFDAVLTVGHAVDIYDPQVLRATTGSFFSLPVIGVSSHTDLINYLKQQQITVVGSDEQGDSSIKELKAYRDKALCIILGNEEKGMSRSLQEICDLMVSIPMRAHTRGSGASSLNIATAAGILFYESFDEK